MGIQMTLDLWTVLVMRLGVDVVYAIAYGVFAFIYPTITGPRWWWKAAVVSGLSTVVALSSLPSSNTVEYSLYTPILMAAIMVSWMGTRDFLGLPLRVHRVALGWLVFALASLSWMEPLHLLPEPQAILWTGVGVLAWVTQNDFRQAQRRADQYGLRAARYLAQYEGLVAVIFLTASVVYAVQGKQGFWLDTDLLQMVLITQAVFLRGVVYVFLLGLRLQERTASTEQQLQTSEGQLRSLIENINAGVLVLNPDRSVANINAAARAIFAAHGDEIDLRPLHALQGAWRPTDEAGKADAMGDTPFDYVLARGKSLSNLLLCVPRPDEAFPRWALCNVFPEKDAEGKLLHVVYTVIDITARERAQQQQQVLEQQLARSQKMEALGTLAGGVAHDFNNILAAILGNAHLAQQDLETDAPAQESLREVSAAARRGRELVRQVLAFSRKQPVSLAPVNLAEVLEESCKLLRAGGSSEVNLQQVVHSRSPIVMGDATQLGQVVVNLGTNALRAMRGRSGSVVFRLDDMLGTDPLLPEEVAKTCLELGGGAVRLLVQDSGCGMSEAVRSRIFEPFFTTETLGQSTGLGLPVVLGIVQSIGGTIQVDSEVDRGTTFAVYLPAVHAPNLAPPSEISLPVVVPEETPSNELPKRHVLYLDDDETLVFLIGRLLERRGYRVSAYVDQQAAIDAVREDPDGFDLVMTDFNMPGMSGLDVARHIAAVNPKLPIAIASGYVTDALQEQAKVMGIREVVFKTDAIEDLCEVVARLLR